MILDELGHERKSWNPWSINYWGFLTFRLEVQRALLQISLATHIPTLKTYLYVYIRCYHHRAGVIMKADDESALRR